MTLVVAKRLDFFWRTSSPTVRGSTVSFPDQRHHSAFRRRTLGPLPVPRALRLRSGLAFESPSIDRLLASPPVTHFCKPLTAPTGLG